VVVIAGDGGIEDVHQRIVEAIAGKLDLTIKG
jgi:hypothetical protein